VIGEWREMNNKKIADYQSFDLSPAGGGCASQRAAGGGTSGMMNNERFNLWNLPFRFRSLAESLYWLERSYVICNEKFEIKTAF